MPAVTPTILSAQIQAARAKIRTGRPLAFRTYDAWSGPEHLILGDQTLTVRECRSDLAVRQAMNEANPDSLVLLVQAPDGSLAEDTLARCAKGRLLDLHPRDTLLSLTGAQAIDPRLLLHREVIDLLVQRWRGDVRLTSTANVIECGRAFALLLNRPSLIESVPDLIGLLLWANEDGMAAVKEAPSFLRTAFFDWLRETNGPALALIEQALEESAQRLVSLGLVLGAVFPESGPPSEASKDAAIRLERYLGGVKVSGATARAWHRAAKAVLLNLPAKQQNNIIKDVDFWLEDLKADELAELSDYSARGFEIRLDSLAAALPAARRSESPKAWLALLAAEQRVQNHWLSGQEAPRLALIRMALRLTQWLRQRPAPAEDSASLPVLAARFLEEGAFVDWARHKLRRGDGREALNKAYAALLAKVDERREQLNRQFADELHPWIAADRKDDGLIPMECVIERALVPLARQTKVLLLVMDGMNGAVFAELMADMELRGWHVLNSEAHQLPRPVLAALPSITAVSRAALFRGRLDASDATTENVSFREHPSLHRAIQSRAKPQLFLKASLADESGTGLASDVRDAIIDSDSKVVGVVINAVDDHLSSMGQLALDWTVGQITWMKDLLDAASVGQRVVVLTSDHGHVPAKESDRSLQLKNAEGDRHRFAPPDPRDGEMAFAGHRLQAATGRRDWIFCQSENLRYGGKKTGYHGGVADQEMIVPLGILTSSSDEIPGFEHGGVHFPSWWSVEETSPVQQPATGATRKKKSPPREAGTLELWAATRTAEPNAPQPAAATASTEEAPPWITQLLDSEVMKQQKNLAGRSPLPDEQVRRVLCRLEASAGIMPMTALARDLGLPQFRIGGFVSQLQRLLNVEGYPVLVNDASQTLRLNRALLLKQFDIPT
jgi:hypothetical protein